jgi:Uma2 family endonuclease
MSEAPAPPTSLPTFWMRPPRLRWTVAEFHELAALPKFENRRMILVDGEILDLPPANHPHDLGIGLVQLALATIFGSGSYWVRVQMALPLGLTTDLIPDLAVVLGAMRMHTVQPSSALLVVEVADSSLAYDTGDKSNLYAAGGIEDYWVIDVANRAVHVFRDPVRDASAPHGFRYRNQQTFDDSATVIPRAMPSASVLVAALLP